MHRRAGSGFVLLAGWCLAYGGASACDSGQQDTVEPGARCVPGLVVGCPCADGRNGSQACLADGTFGVCSCPDSGAIADATLSDQNAPESSAGDAPPPPNDGEAPDATDAPGDAPGDSPDDAYALDAASDSPEEDADALDAASDSPEDADATDASDSGSVFGTPQISCIFAVAAPGRQFLNGVSVSASGTIAVAGGLTAALADGGGPVFDMGDGTPLPAPPLPNGAPPGPTYGGFAAKFDSACQLQWARSLPYGLGIAFDGAENMWTFGALDHTTTTTLTKLSPTGVTLFQATFGSTPNDLVQGRGVSVDVARGDVVLAGTYYGAPSIGGAALPSVGNGAAIFVTKFSAGGVHLWDRVFASASDAGLCYWQANAIARHSTGDLIVSASLSGQGPGASCGITIGGATAPPGVFVARLSDVDGTPVWANFGAGGESACVTSQDAVVTSGLSGTLSHLLADGGGPSWTARLPNNTASQVVCGGDLGERSLAAGGAPTLLQAVEENGALGWGVTLPNPASPSLALGPNRAFVLAGATGQSPPFGTEDVYFARYVR